MPYNYLLHHSESVDPELIEAIIHKIISITGFSSFTMVVILVIFMVSIPLLIMIFYFTNFKRNN
ncbi:MAG: hypothetical protein CL746_03120 [Chloroflexi bacterium]|nr:hypothetical protein [Chloroflexota bacterium]MBL01636.1 hypothetical protein [Chloroflexota bacterium]|tara:strand:- start:146 stop:337 length:192 start_codon:yes stop_codon:yes gene_type:complete